MPTKLTEFLRALDLDELDDLVSGLRSGGAADEEIAAVVEDLLDQVLPLPQPWEAASDIVISLLVQHVIGWARDPEKREARKARRAERKQRRQERRDRRKAGE